MPKLGKHVSSIARFLSDSSEHPAMHEDHEAELRMAIAAGFISRKKAGALAEESRKQGKSPLELLNARGLISDAILAGFRTGGTRFAESLVRGVTPTDHDAETLIPGVTPTDRDEADPEFPVPGWERYRPVRFLAQGGGGRIFLAYDPLLRRSVALKFVRGDDSELIRRFLSEAQAQARVEHERVCKVYEVGEVQGQPFIVMQYVDGLPLDRLASELQLTVKQKVMVLREAAEGVHAAHRAGLIHKDLKPSNILVERTHDGQLKPFVMDFGLAEDLISLGIDEGTVVGTPHYMSPEQACGEVERLDKRTDVYSLGATLYTLLTGQHAIPGANALEVLSNITTVEPIPPRTLDPNIPADLEAIVLKCLEKDRAARYDSARAFIEDLDRFLEGKPVLAPSSRRTLSGLKGLLASVFGLPSARPSPAHALPLESHREKPRAMKEVAVSSGQGAPRASRQIFISYTHESEAQKEQVLQLAQRLRRDGIDCRLDRFVMSPPEGWPHWCRLELEKADFVLVICTELYQTRFDHRGESPHGAGWEAGLIQQALYDSDSRNEKFIPVLLSNGSEQHIPGPLRGTSRYRMETDYEVLLRRLTGQPEIVPAKLGQVPKLPARHHGVVMSAGAISQAPSPVPVYGNEHEESLAKDLNKLMEQKAELVIAGRSTQEIQQKILELRRVMREGAKLQAGDLLGDGRYKLLERTGQGGFASIWRSYDRQNQEAVAVKVLHGHLAEERTTRERFFRGAMRMTKLGHPNVVRVLQAKGAEGNFHFFVMEFVPGGDLRQAILERKLDAQGGLHLLLQVAPALAYAHEQGLVHRDVKPSNILVGADRPKLTDFDLVWAEDTTQGTVGGLGSVPYVAPEVSHAMDEVTPAADVYSLAMCVVFTLFGRALPMAVLRNINHFIKELPCGSGTQDVLHRALEIEPARRFSSINEFAKALARSVNAQDPSDSEP